MPHPTDNGIPHPSHWGYGHPSLWGYPIWLMEGTPSGSRGYTRVPPCWDWKEVPHQKSMGYPPPISQMGYPPIGQMMHPPSGKIGIPARGESEQQREHLLGGGQYAFCVQTGGLSYSNISLSCQF